MVSLFFNKSNDDQGSDEEAPKLSAQHISDIATLKANHIALEKQLNEFKDRAEREMAGVERRSEAAHKQFKKDHDDAEKSRRNRDWAVIILLATLFGRKLMELLG